MGKFKVGDRVRRVAHSGNIYNCPIGHETTVDRLLSWGFCYIGADGSEQNTSNMDDWALVSSGPVRTVTRTEVVPGVYGRIGIGLADSKSVLFGITGHMNAYAQFSRAELTAAIATLTTIRDALDEVA